MMKRYGSFLMMLYSGTALTASLALFAFWQLAAPGLR